MPNIEESIRIAMRELGIDADDTDTEEVVTENDVTEDVEEISEDVDETGESETTPAVYVKIKDGIVALIFGSDIEFQHKELGGKPMNVLSFKMPDVSSEKLQELEVISESEKPECTKIEKEVKKPEPEPEKKAVKRTPIVNKEDSTEDSNDVLTELKNQKQAIDLQIKDARADGDTELVNSLRKRRRALRNKINSIGG